MGRDEKAIQSCNFFPGGFKGDLCGSQKQLRLAADEIASFIHNELLAKIIWPVFHRGQGLADELHHARIALHGRRQPYDALFMRGQQALYLGPVAPETAVASPWAMPWISERMRPRDLDEFVGQGRSLGPGAALRRAIETDDLRSVILWGPPGSGKTTVSHAILERVGRDRIAYLQHDAYYRDRAGLPLEERARINYDHPDSLETDLLVEHLKLLRTVGALDRLAHENHLFANLTQAVYNYYNTSP